MTAARFGHRMPWGAEVVDGGARFRLWAPAQERVALVVADTDQTLPMQQAGDGWFELTTDAVKVGRGYGFDLPDGRFVPDPAARAQMANVHGFSRLVDPGAYEWQTIGWKGRPWQEAVIYELHTGAFSTEGTFDGVARDLDRLGNLGITTIELLPVAQFGGDRGWGYDGVLLYAPHTAYGGPEGLKRLVDAAHERELMMLLDVVYNHLGPDGNYLALYASDFFDPKRETPWGNAIDFHQRPVREFFLHNALYWLEEFRFDGLRLDAIDKIEDAADDSILAEMAREVRNRFPDRHVHLTIEDDDNSTRLLKFDADNRLRLFDAEWNDDWHHAMHSLLTGERDGYYQDYADAPARRVAETMALGFGYQGAPSAYRGGKRRGEPSEHLPPTAFIDFLQNHDQVGNRADGKRLDSLVAPEAVEAGLALLLLSPHIPLLFMGEEYGERARFYFFTDFQGELAEAVRKGRNEEFHANKAFTEAFSQDLVPDPNAFDTFAASKLDPARWSHEAAETRTQLLKRLIEARGDYIIPKLAAVGGHAGRVEAVKDDAFVVSWILGEGAVLTLIANLASRETRLCVEAAGFLVFAHPEGADRGLAQHRLPAWSVIGLMGTQS